MSWPAVLLPDTLDELLALLAEHGDEMKVLAGGTALLLMIRNGLVDPEGLISLGRLRELREVDIVPGRMRLGALVTLRRLERLPSAGAALPVLTQTLSLVANPRVRTSATVGGVVAESDYASDPPCVLHALGADVNIRSATAARTLAIDEFLVDYYETALNADELVVSVDVPLPGPEVDWVYRKYQTRSTEDRPCVGVAALAERDAGGAVTDLRVSVGAASAVPFRVPGAEAMAVGRRLDDPELVREVGAAYAAATEPISDTRGSGAYRKKMIAVQVRRALEDLEAKRRWAVKV